MPESIRKNYFSISKGEENTNNNISNIGSTTLLSRLYVKKKDIIDEIYSKDVEEDVIGEDDIINEILKEEVTNDTSRNLHTPKNEFSLLNNKRVNSSELRQIEEEQEGEVDEELNMAIEMSLKENSNQFNK